MKFKLKIFTLLLACILNYNIAYANTNEGKIDLNKYATIDTINNRKAKITLEINPNHIIENINSDIVFVIDRSSSMNNKIPNEEISKIESLKNITKNLVNTLLDENKNNKIGIVTFGTSIINNSTTNKITSNQNEIINLINNIPSLSNEATNIQIGLNKAYNLLKDSENENKYIILLTDGEPTAFTYNNNIYGTFYDDSRVWYDNYFLISLYARPSQRAKLESDAIKNENIKLHSIGFGINEESTNFLKTISDKYTTANDTNELSDILEKTKNIINTISTNTYVEDYIPNTFTLDETSIETTVGSKPIITKNNNSTKIKWEIGDLIAHENTKLTYDITLNEPYYGNIFTNIEAKIIGKPTINNKYYKNDFSLFFNIPTLKFPAITTNDNYELFETKKLSTNINNSILSNDKMELILNNNDTINNKIVITENVLCGLLTINNDNSFTYDSKDCKDNVNWKYYILSNINGSEIRSNISNVNIKINKLPVSYTINYIDEEKNKLLDSIEKNGFLNNLITENYKEIDGYKLINEKTQILKLKENNNVINFIYKKINYTLKEKLIKNGTDYIDNTNDNIEYAINYKQTLNDYNGKIDLKIIDYLPYKIDINKSNIDDGIYDEKNKTITWIISDNTIKNTEYKIDFNRTISIKYIDIPNDTNNITNKVKTLIILNNNKHENEDIWTTNINKYGKVTIKYVDNNYKNIIEPIIIENFINSEYKSELKEFNNFEFLEVIGLENGTITNENQEIIYVYKNIETPPKTGIDESNYLYSYSIIIISSTFIILKYKHNKNIT